MSKVKKLDKLGVSAFCESMGMMARAGIQTDEAIALLGQSKQTEGILGTALEQMKQSVEQGNGLSQAMEETGIFPEYALKMIRAGESAGRMEDVLMRLKFCREMLRTILFLSGDLARAGIGPDEQAARIHLLEQLAAKTEDESKTHELQRKILGEIRQAAESALEAAGHIRAETERPGRSAPGEPAGSVRAKGKDTR